MSRRRAAGRSPAAARMLLGSAALVLLGAAACDAPRGSAPAGTAEGRTEEERAGPVLERAMAEIEAAADSLDELLQPLPLLRPAEESALRSRLNEDHLRQARRLGFRPPGEAALDSLVAEGRLVRLADTTQHWVIRELDHSVPYVVPHTQTLLERIAGRFHARLDSLGLPAWRLEVSSVLRTAEQQADLRRANPNAAAGVSTHEFGTTVDIPYSAFAAPARPIAEPDVSGAGRLERPVRRVADGVAERVAARKSRELQAVLGRVLREMQSEGLVHVTLERQQPVYHVTVAAPLADGG